MRVQVEDNTKVSADVAVKYRGGCEKVISTLAHNSSTGTDVMREMYGNGMGMEWEMYLNLAHNSHAHEYHHSCEYCHSPIPPP